MSLTNENIFDLDTVSKGPYRGEPFGVHTQVISKHTHACIYIHIYTHIYTYIQAFIYIYKYIGNK